MTELVTSHLAGSRDNAGSCQWRLCVSGLLLYSVLRQVNTTTHFISLPGDPELREEWCHKVSRPGYKPDKYDRVSSVHFEL